MRVTSMSLLIQVHYRSNEQCLVMKAIFLCCCREITILKESLRLAVYKKIQALSEDFSASNNLYSNLACLEVVCP
jgi:hypothetical protein